MDRAVENVYPNREFLEEKLMSGEKLTLYWGIDPTSAHVHIGHAIQLMKLRHFVELGHEVIVLVGDFTAMIGDPTDKSAARTQLTRQEVLDNAKHYKKRCEESSLGF